MFASIANFFRTRHRYRVAFEELSQLSNRDLADIGISRSDIPRLAYEYAHSHPQDPCAPRSRKRHYWKPAATSRPAVVHT